MGDAHLLVLVVDDDRAVRESLSFALEFEGLEVLTCAGSSELLAHPRLAEAACLIVDYQMPSMNGFELIVALRARKLWMPAILITGHATAALSRRAAVAGVRHVIEKPLSDGALVASIQEVLGLAHETSPLH